MRAVPAETPMLRRAPRDADRPDQDITSALARRASDAQNTAREYRTFLNAYRVVTGPALHASELCDR